MRERTERVIAVYGNESILPQFQVQRHTPGVGWFNFRHPFQSAKEAENLAQRMATEYPGTMYRVVEETRET